MLRQERMLHTDGYRFIGRWVSSFSAGRDNQALPDSRLLFLLTIWKHRLCCGPPPGSLALLVNGALEASIDPSDRFSLFQHCFGNCNGTERCILEEVEDDDLVFFDDDIFTDDELFAPPPVDDTCSGAQVDVRVLTDSNGHDIHIYLLDFTELKLVAHSTELGDNRVHTLTECIDPDLCYLLQVYDLFGDGLTVFSGGMTIFVGGDAVLTAGGNQEFTFDDSEELVFIGNC